MSEDQNRSINPVGEITDTPKPKGIAVDDRGRYCGLNEVTRKMQEVPPNLVGYCGPDCDHCKDARVYCLQDGVWVCAADYDYDYEGG
jgi:hypothetical protein